MAAAALGHKMVQAEQREEQKAENTNSVLGTIGANLGIQAQQTAAMFAGMQAQAQQDAQTALMAPALFRAQRHEAKLAGGSGIGIDLGVPPALRGHAAMQSEVGGM